LEIGKELVTFGTLSASAENTTNMLADGEYGV
jgi:hypothetical protein